MKDNLFWVKYRPKTIEEMCLPTRVAAIFNSTEQVNFVFSGPSGRGKTTLAGVLSSSKATLFINVGDDNSVDILRDDIRSFCSRYAIGDYDPDDYKVVVLDEYEKATASFEAAFKGFIEQQANNVRFIITTNAPDRIDPAVLSRCTHIKFDWTKEESTAIYRDYCLKLWSIAEKENIIIQPENIKTIVKSVFPDLRKAIQGLQEWKGGFYQTASISDNAKIFDILYNIPTDQVIFDIALDNLLSINELSSDLGRPYLAWLKQKDINAYVFTLKENIKTYAEFQRVKVEDPVISVACLMMDYTACLITYKNKNGTNK